jgi:uncharacterized protein YdeI (YjbR/CyaY-like superfamily)
VSASSYERLSVTTRAEWRAWLAEHHATSPGVWLVQWKHGRGQGPDYEDVVEQAQCYGRVDSQVRSLDADRAEQLLTPRRRTSVWARSNKERVARLTAAGLMTPAGLAVVEQAKASGQWTLLDDAENLVEPPDLRAALDASPAARTAWDAFSPSARKMLLGWIATAKRAPTRERRIATTVSEAAQGRRAGQPRD